MKKVFGFLSSVFRGISPKSKTAFLLLNLPICLLANGCFVNYYTTGTKHGLGDTTLSVFENKERYFIIHLADKKVMALQNIRVRDSLIDADMMPVSTDHSRYLNPDPDSALSYKKKYKVMLNEVHLYAPDEKLENKTHLSVPKSSISRLDIYDKNYGATVSNQIISGIGVAALLCLFVLTETNPWVKNSR